MVEILVGVNITDQALYSEYRARMTPLLEQHGGSFRLDLRVAEVLRSPDDQPFNRLFTIRFPTQQSLDAFFAHPEYLQIRNHYFTPSVSHTARFARYEVSG